MPAAASRPRPAGRLGRKRPPARPKANPGSVASYLAAQPPVMRAALKRIRSLVRAAAPRAVEVISYRMPAFRTERGVLVWYAGFPSHGSFFPGALPRFPELAKAMAPFASAKGTLRFTPERPLPASLITRLVKARLREQAAGA